MQVALTDPWFEAMFIGKISDDGRTYARLTSIDGAQGLTLWCPCGYGDPRYPLEGGRPHAILVPFSNPRNAPPVPPTFGPVGRDKVHRPRWAMSGTGLHDLTLQPSISVGTPECWHGYIQNGQVTDVPDHHDRH